MEERKIFKDANPTFAKGLREAATLKKKTSFYPHSISNSLLRSFCFFSLSYFSFLENCFNMQMKTPARFHPLSPMLLHSCQESILKRWPFSSDHARAEFIKSDVVQWGMICYPSSLNSRIELVVISIAVLFLVDGTTHPTVLMAELLLTQCCRRVGRLFSRGCMYIRFPWGTAAIFEPC